MEEHVVHEGARIMLPMRKEVEAHPIGETTDCSRADDRFLMMSREWSLQQTDPQ